MAINYDRLAADNQDSEIQGFSNLNLIQIAFQIQSMMKTMNNNPSAAFMIHSTLRLFLMNV
jgi:hypothetical protein